MPVLFAVGFGYSVEPLAQQLKAEGWEIHATTRDPSKAEKLEANGIRGHLWNGKGALPELAGQADAIVISVPPGEMGCPAVTSIENISPDTVLIYLSSSGVYGDHQGEWVDEETPCLPLTARARRRLLAESQWRYVGRYFGVRHHICRLAGIYGPGRNALLSLKGGTRGSKAGLAQRIIKPGQVFNRIHRDDIAAGLYALIEAETAPTVINFADDEPAPPQDVITYAAELLGIEPPPKVPFEQAEMSDMARSFYEDNKRLKNDGLKALSGFSLKYPSYREGLQDLLAGI
ncbi:SDR family oxidoreductase [Parvularcula marina]|uniref:SDR family oxidoreductase n=1 Tax=Parvularcula marina TaxID=2292771 RepID=A0A371RIL4_9PROT|nr:SDR family oxidoreductase [Parvularcula marina]RFB05294.1 SDR family oxidoreductase [Parvularcula marina]